MIAPIIALTITQVQGLPLTTEPDELQTLTITGSEMDGAGVEVSIGSSRVCGPQSSIAGSAKPDSSKATWAYVILAPLHGDFLVWVDMVPEKAQNRVAVGADEFDSYVNGDAGGSEFSVDSFGNRRPY